VVAIETLLALDLWRRASAAAAILAAFAAICAVDSRNPLAQQLRNDRCGRRVPR
jgi:hypothetical protein